MSKSFNLSPSGICLGSPLDMLLRGDVVLPFWELCLEVRKPAFGFQGWQQTSCVTLIKSPNSSGMLAPCMWKEEVGIGDSLPNPSSFHFPLGFWFVMRGYREEKEAPGVSYSLTAAPWWLSLPNHKSGLMQEQAVYSHLGLPLLDIAPETRLDFISWVRNIWNTNLEVRGPMSENPWKKFWVKSYGLWTSRQRWHSFSLMSPNLESEIFPFSPNALSDLLTKNTYKRDL